jgi:hypothetical protein
VRRRDQRCRKRRSITSTEAYFLGTVAALIPVELGLLRPLAWRRRIAGIEEYLRYHSYVPKDARGSSTTKLQPGARGFTRYLLRT